MKNNELINAYFDGELSEIEKESFIKQLDSDPDLKNEFDFQKNKIHLFSRQVFITDEVKDVVPDFLMLLHGVIDSPDIPLNVSRSFLLADSNVRKINAHISKKVADKGIEVDVLINNAGFGDHGQFVESAMAKTIDMLNLNVVNLTELSLIYGKQFADKKIGMLLNVASTAAFQAIPKMSVYAATKAYVLHFTEAMHFELRGTGVHVSALCPGPTKTGFMEAASMGESPLFDKNAMSAKAVAEKGYKGLKKNKAVIITGFKNVFFARIADATPFRKLKVWIASKMV